MLFLNTHNYSDLLSLAHKRKKVILMGTVLQPARITQDTARTEVMIDGMIIHGGIKHLNEKVLLTIYNHTKDFSPGEKIRFPARLRTFKNFNNPGRFNYELAMKLKGLSCAASITDGRRIVPMGKGNLGRPRRLMEDLRRPIRDHFRKKLSPKNQALFRALILGERQGIEQELRESFNIAGLGHILAVSGLHIGLVAWLVFSLSRWLLSLFYRLTLRYDIRRLSAILTCLPVVIYAFLAGFQVSSQRAMIMILAYLLSIIFKREKEVWSTLALAALMVLVLDPYELFSISFQLSFCAVIGILWLYPVIYERIPKPFDRPGEKGIGCRLYIHISSLFAVTMAAVIFLLPFSAFYFHRISAVSIFSNIMVLPILGICIIPLGLISAISLYISQSMADIFLQMGVWALDLMMWIIQFWAHLDWAAFWVITPNAFEIIIFYSLILFLYFFRRWAWAKIGLGLVLLILAADISFWIYGTQCNKHLKVTYLDVGQGSSTLVQFPGRQRMLIDGGGFPRGHFDVGRMVVAPSLLYSKILSIDYLVLTHPQSDHMNGLHFIASYFQPKEFWFNGDRVDTPSYSELMKILESKKIKKVLPPDLSRGKEIAGVKIELLHPQGDIENRQSFGGSRRINNNSMALKLTYQGKSILFLGDLDSKIEEFLISTKGKALESHVMLAPHHGSRGSSSKPFLRTVGPDICIISSGSGNPFGFPHLETIQRLRETGCRILRIDQVGALQLTVSADGIKVTSLLGLSGATSQ